MIELSMGSETFRSSDEGRTVCARCVMDTSDPDIVFDERGVCNHCVAADLRMAAQPSQVEKEKQLRQLVERIKVAGRDKPYDSILGLSGGVDSSYLALVAHDLGLRPLAVHLDNGWDSELAVSNIQKIVQGLGFDLYTHVVDWEEFRDIQASFLKASVIDVETPTDHGIFALMFEQALAQRVGFILIGSNHATESSMPAAWGYRKVDLRHLKAIQRRFGSKSIRTLPTMSTLRMMYLERIRKISRADILNLVPYERDDAIEQLQTRLGWTPYQGKHHESVFTRFYQTQLLPEKFGVDKRKSHLSSLIVSGQITRGEALKTLADPEASGEDLQADRDYVLKKLGLSRQDYEEILNRPVVSHEAYPTDTKRVAILSAVYRSLKPKSFRRQSRAGS